MKVTSDDIQECITALLLFCLIGWMLEMVAAILGMIHGLAIYSSLAAGLLFAGFLLHRSQLELPISGKGVLVTGCDSGFGLHLSQHLHSLGFTVYAGCLLKDKNGEGACQLQSLASPCLHVLQLDVTSQESVDKAMAYIKDHLPSGGLWGIVNNAGLATFGCVEWVPISTYTRLMDVNLWGEVRVTKAALPLLRKTAGRVVNMASMLARMSVPTHSPYCITKYAVEGFSDCLRYELRKFGVRVSIIEPGNYIAGTNIFTEESIRRHTDEMWEIMDQEVKDAYGTAQFNSAVRSQTYYASNGITDISPVIGSMTCALVRAHPRLRYQPMTLYYKVRIFIATHLPEIFYDTIYM